MGRQRGTPGLPLAALGGNMIRITAKRNGFRRAGMAHYGTQEYPDGFFDAETLASLKAEAMLVVEEVKETAASDTSSGNGKGKAKA